MCPFVLLACGVRNFHYAKWSGAIIGKYDKKKERKKKERKGSAAFEKYNILSDQLFVVSVALPTSLSTLSFLLGALGALGVGG